MWLGFRMLGNCGENSSKPMPKISRLPFILKLQTIMVEYHVLHACEVSCSKLCFIIKYTVRKRSYSLRPQIQCILAIFRQNKGECNRRLYPSLAFLMYWNLILFRMIKGWTISLLIQNMTSIWITFLIWNNHVFYLSKHYLLVLRMYYIWVQISNDRMHLISGLREYWCWHSVGIDFFSFFFTTLFHPCSSVFLSFFLFSSSTGKSFAALSKKKCSLVDCSMLLMAVPCDANHARIEENI